MKKYDNTRKKSCSVWLVITVLIIIFLLLLGGIFYLKFKSNFNLNDYSLRKNSLNDSLSKQLSDQLGENTVQIRITEEELSKIINADSTDFPLKSTSVKIAPEKVILKGKTGNSPLSFRVEVGIIPKAENNKINFDIQEIKTAGVSAPKVVTDSVNQKLSSYLKQFSLREDISVTEVKLYSGYLVVIGERV